MKKTILLLTVFVLLFSVAVCWAKVQAQSGETAAEGDKSLYDRAYKLYENKKYYDAYKLFNKSQYGDWERMAKKCVRRWPQNGQTWRDTTQWLQDTQLTFKVEQPDDTAIYIRVYKDEKPVSNVFIGGTDEITLMLPGNGNYTIRDGVGANWFGVDDMFGDDGAYETMTFGERDETFIYLEQRYDYTITINVDDAIGEDIGSEDAVRADLKN